MSQRLFILAFFFLLLLSSCHGPSGKYRAAAKSEGKYGYIDESGSFVIDPEYDQAWSFIRGTAVVKQNGKFGLIDKDGDWVMKPAYDSVIPFSSSCFIFQKDSLFGFAEHGTGKELSPPQWEQVYYYTSDLCVVQKGKGLGVYDPFGRMTCPPVLQDLKEMTGPLAKVIQSDTTDELAMLLNLMQEGSVQAGLLNSKGVLVTPCKYDDIFDDASKGYYYPFLRDSSFADDTLSPEETPVAIGKFGIADTAGNILCEPMFDELPVFGEGMFRVRIGELYGFADQNGKVMIQPQWEYATAFSEGKAIVSMKGNTSIIDKTGKILAAELGPGAGMYRFSCGLARCRSVDGKYGFLNARGVRVIPPRFDVADDFDHNVAIVNLGSYYGLIDTTGKFLIEPKYDFIFNLGDGFFQVKNEEGESGVVNQKGEIVLQTNFDEIFHLQKNYFAVERQFLSGCYDITGKQIFPVISIPQIFFNYGRSLVTKEGKYGLIDTTGKYLIQPQYDSIPFVFKGIYTVVQQGVYGAVDSTGKVLVAPRFTELRPFVNGYAIFREKGKYGYIDMSGKVVIEATLEDAAVLVDPDRKEFE